MKIEITLILISGLLFPSFMGADTLKAGYDERVELMSVLCHLAGYGEYRGRAPGYQEAVDSYFSDFKGHPAVKMMRRLRRDNSIGYDAPMNLAIRIEKGENGNFSITDREHMGNRFASIDLQAMLDTLQTFYRDTDFGTFFSEHEPFYRSVCESFDNAVTSRANQEWYRQFYGREASEDYVIVMAFLNGGSNYGPSLEPDGERRRVYAILGYYIDDDGQPYFETHSDSDLNTLIHEFNHSFVNYLLDEETIERFSPYGERLQQLSANTMNRQAYSDWQTILNESLVRAAVVCYMLDNESVEAARKALVGEISHGFMWMPGLVEKLKEYSKNRTSYPDLKSFYPEILSFLEGYVATLDSQICSALSTPD